MLYNYACYAKKHKKLHAALILLIIVILVAHVLILLETENPLLLIGLAIYVPVYLIWARISTISDRLPD